LAYTNLDKMIIGDVGSTTNGMVSSSQVSRNCKLFAIVCCELEVIREAIRSWNSRQV